MRPAGPTTKNGFEVIIMIVSKPFFELKTVVFQYIDLKLFILFLRLSPFYAVQMRQTKGVYQYRKRASALSIKRGLCYLQSVATFRRKNREQMSLSELSVPLVLSASMIQFDPSFLFAPRIPSARLIPSDLWA